MDGDGQHSAKDMIKLINNLKDNDLVIGSRDLNKTKSINPVRIFFSKIFNFILKFFSLKSFSVKFNLISSFF